MPHKRRSLVLFLLPALLSGQNAPELRQVLERLDRLEKQNQALMDEIQALRLQLTERASAPAAPAAAEPEQAAPLDERLAVHDARLAELEQSKIASEHRLPVTFTGMVLFNAFRNGTNNGGQQNPVVASLLAEGAAEESSGGGATLRQTLLGLKFQGPEIIGGGKISGSLFMDFFGGSSEDLHHMLRIRVATLEARWKNTSFVAGQDKPLLSPREPNSLAQVGVSPLTGSGNLWLWRPQARIEQRFHFGENAGLAAQLGVYQTSETVTTVPAEYVNTIAPARPGLEGRFEFWRQWGDARRVEIAPGFHRSSTHAVGRTVDSNVISVDWLIQPSSKFDFSGMYFHGQNVAVLGALRQGFTVIANVPRPVHSSGGWAQLAYRPTSRLSFHLYGGRQDDRNADLLFGNIGSNQTYALNVIYRFGPNVLAGIEGSQVRTDYIGLGKRLNNHYDLALAYLF